MNPLAVLLLPILCWAPLVTQGAAIVPISQTVGFTNSANLNSPLGSNLSSVVDFSSELPFVNHMRMARPWFSASSTTFQDNRPLQLDLNGNVLSLEPGQFARTVVFTGTPADPGLAGKGFHLFYKGQGRLSYNNVDVLSQSPGHDVIRLRTISGSDTELTAIITIEQTDIADPVRDLRLVLPGGICVKNPLQRVKGVNDCPPDEFLAFSRHDQDILFNPEFLQRIQSYRSLRFMDWMRTNNSTQTSFDKRPLPQHQFWSTESGVPLEVMIALVNLMDMDPWFNIPHLANDDYVRAFATLVDQDMEPGRRAYIEYSNEVWNGLFTQTGYATKKGIQLGLNILDNGQIDDATGMVRFYSRRAQRIFDLFSEVMGGSDRIRRVMATQAVVPYFTEEILKFGKARSKTDVFAIAPYFGDTIVDQTKRDELLSLGVDGVFDWLQNDNNAVLDFGSLPSIDRVILNQLQVLRQFGIPLTSYEGGQHFLAAGSLSNDAELNNLMDALNRDPRMKSIYLAYLKKWRKRTGEVFHHYVHTDRWSVFGRWGALEFPSQKLKDAPKFNALMTYIETTPLP
ncbi:MAG: hypothetical protein AB1717_01140 [Pseudomonadota bacterium]